jgi:hypothetical protein
MTLLDGLVKKHGDDYENDKYDRFEDALLAFGRELLMKVAEEMDEELQKSSEECKEARRCGLSVARDFSTEVTTFSRVARRLRELASAGEGKNG